MSTQRRTARGTTSTDRRLAPEALEQAAGGVAEIGSALGIAAFGLAGAADDALDQGLAGGRGRQLAHEIELVAQHLDRLRILGEFGGYAGEIRGRADRAGERAVQVEPYRRRRERPLHQERDPRLQDRYAAGVLALERAGDPRRDPIID